MYDAFISQLTQRALFDPGKRYLLACSGGMDSMALAHLLWKAGVSFELAHVNFGLRGEESDGDESFVRAWAKERNLLVHVHQAQTKKIAENQGISIQMAAREIRYHFFETLRSQQGLEGIVLAHHEDDQLETILLNLLRGTGIEGMYGMSERRDWLIRPLLSFSRQEIAAYMEREQLSWREDSSNASSDYKRNKLRHSLMPALYDQDKDARKNLLHSFGRLKDTGRAFSTLFQHWKTAHVTEHKGIQYLPYTALLQVQGGATLLYFWLRPYGFNADQATSIFESLDDINIGAFYLSPSYQLSMDRKEMMLHPILPPFEAIDIPKGEVLLALPEGDYELKWEVASATLLDRNPSHALLDADQLTFPLQVRSWQEGDRFSPLGMSTEKKVSDFLIDNKVPLALKKDVKVLVSGNKIAWILGMRIADWAKVSTATQHTLHIKKATP
jgi:tRNA(Ile)-lysidine synthase